MAVRVTVLILLSGLCGVLCQNIVNIITVHDGITEQADELDSLDDPLIKILETVALDTEGFDLETDLDETLQLVLDDSELVGGCSHGVCQYCTGKVMGKFKFCLTARLLKTGFQLTVKLGSHTIFDKQITVTKPVRVCIPYVPVVGKVCIAVDKINLQTRSACVSVQFKVFHRKVNVKIACFKIGQAADLRLPFIQLAQALSDRRIDQQ